MVNFLFMGFYVMVLVIAVTFVLVNFSGLLLTELFFGIVLVVVSMYGVLSEMDNN